MLIYACDHALCALSCKLTTDVLSPDQRGPLREPHLFVGSLQAGMRSWTSSGSVATFTSDRALAQAEELTSHMKENTTVTIKSWRRKHRGLRTNSRQGPIILFLPGRKKMHETYNERPSSVLTVLVQKEDVDGGGHEGIQEGKDGNGYEELSRWGVVSSEEHALPPRGLTHGGFKRHLI